MSVSDLIEKLGKTIFETPFDAALSPKETPELAEIRLAVIEKILKKGQRAGGKIIFPYNLIRVQVQGVGEEEAGFFHAEFLRTYFAQEIKKALAKSNYRFADDLEVEFATSEQLPERGEEWLRVEADSRPRKEPAAPPHRTARLVVIRGNANAPEITLGKDRINIGRTVEVYRAQGPSRRNDLAFTEASEINSSVSREHAHILHSKKTGEYRLYNDRWYKPGKGDAASCGLWIIRGGLSQEVPRGPRGVRLQAGDEIQLGRAILKFQVK